MTITTDTTLLHDPRRQAALLYWQGFSVPQIAAMLQMKRPTVQSWKQRDGWDSVAPAYFHERRSLNNFHRDRVITFEQIAE